MSELTPAPVPSDRYAEAVRARRAELGSARAELATGHRGELRAALALARLAATAELVAEVARLGRQAQAYLDRCSRRERCRFPVLMLAAVDDLQHWMSGRRLATVRAATRRVARRRGVPIEPGWPAAGERHPAPKPTSPGPAGSLWSGVVRGWRVALLPAAALPLVGLPVVAGSSTILIAVVLGIVAAAVVGNHHAAVADRARLRRWCDEILIAVRADGEAALAGLLIQLEQTAGTDLDTAVARLRAEVDAEIAAIASAPSEVAGG